MTNPNSSGVTSADARGQQRIVTRNVVIGQLFKKCFLDGVSCRLTCWDGALVVPRLTSTGGTDHSDAVQHIPVELGKNHI